MTMIVDDDTGVAVVLEGRPRQDWRRQTHAEWHLAGVWPSPRERGRLLKRLRSGQPMLVVQNNGGETVDLFDEEVRGPRRLSQYVTDCGGGVTTLYIPSLNWLPSKIARSARTFIQDQAKLHAAIGAERSAILTPPLGRRMNLRVLQTADAETTRVTPHSMKELIDLAFPPCKSQTRRTA